MEALPYLGHATYRRGLPDLPDVPLSDGTSGICHLLMHTSLPGSVGGHHTNSSAGPVPSVADCSVTRLQLLQLHQTRPGVSVFQGASQHGEVVSIFSSQQSELHPVTADAHTLAPHNCQSFPCRKLPCRDSCSNSFLGTSASGELRCSCQACWNFHPSTGDQLHSGRHSTWL